MSLCLLESRLTWRTSTASDRTAIDTCAVAHVTALGCGPDDKRRMTEELDRQIDLEYMKRATTPRESRVVDRLGQAACYDSIPPVQWTVQQRCPTAR